LEETTTRLSETFSNYGPFVEDDVLPSNICRTLYSILERSIADALPDTDARCVRTLASYTYDDGTPILTATMVVGPLKDVGELIQRSDLKRWEFADIDWNGPTEIAVPSLGLREKLAIDQLLPDADSRTILQTLRLNLAARARDSKKQMDHYLLFYR